MKIKAIAIASVLAVSTAVAMTACSSNGSATPATPARIVASATAPAIFCAQLPAWIAGGGEAHLNTIETDLNQGTSDATDGNVIALEEIDGPALTTDAVTALADPMPGSSAYATAMADIATAGSDLTAGDWNDATVQLNTATALVGSVTAAVADCT
jgi:hypothetical protein